MTLTRLVAPNLSSPHAFLGRTGGVSTGLFHSLNVGLGSADARAAVHANRATAASVLGLAEGDLVTVRQVHGAEVAVADRWTIEARPAADAIVTDQPGLALGILTADCAPLLFEDRAAGVVAAAHAGWKGAIGGVIEATIAAMERLGARRADIAAAVGPCISRESYEVDEGFRARFVGEDQTNGRFFAAGRPGRWQFDLEGYCLARLAGAGIGSAVGLGVDTRADAERFFSYRRATLAGEADYGRQVSLIRL